MDPSIEYVIYLTFAAVVLDFLLSVFQSIQSDHFKSTCGKNCCMMENELIVNTKQKSEEGKE